MYGPHVSATMRCQKYADRLLVFRGADDRERFAKLARVAIAELGPNVGDDVAESIVDSMFRCAKYDPYEWRRNVALTFERIRNGWA